MIGIQMSDENASARIPRAPKSETYWEKTVRKCSKEPLVPIGGLATAAILVLVQYYLSLQWPYLKIT